MSEQKNEDRSKQSAPKQQGIVYHWQGYKGDIHPQTFPSLTQHEVVKADLGTSHYLFLTKDQLVFACGNNARGQLGIGKAEAGPFNEPVLIEELSGKGVIDVVCGFSHSAALCENGDVYCWGESANGECGTGKTDVVISPERVEFSSTDTHQGAGQQGENAVKICQVACGKIHTLALSKDGRIWAWGTGVQLGVKGLPMTTSPVLVRRLEGHVAVSVYCGENYSAALVRRSGASSNDTSPTPASKLRVRHVLDNDDVTTCAACNEEIFSFTETLDTCIITEAHKCLIASELSPSEYSATQLPHSCSRGKLRSPKDDQEMVPIANKNLNPHSGPTKTENTGGKSSEEMTKADQESENKQTSSPATPNTNEQTGMINNVPSELTPLTEQETNSELTPLTEQETNSELTPLTEQQTNSELTPLKEQETNSELTPLTEQQTNSKLTPLKEQESKTNQDSDPLSPVIDNDNKEETSSEVKAESLNSSLPADNVTDGEPTEVSPVWKMRPEFEKEKDSAVASEGAGETVLTTASRLSNSGVVINDPKSKEYLAKQFEDDLPKQEKKSAVVKNAPPDETSSSYEAMFSSGFVQFSNLTGKAFSNFRSSIASMISTEPDDLAKSIGQDLGHHSGESDEKSNTLVKESSFTNSSDENVMMKSVNSLNLSPESPRRSIISLSDSPERSTESIGQQCEVKEKETSTGVHYVKDTLETEVWTWGKNTKGQLGHGDMGDRETPCCIKMLSSKNIVKLATGSFHTLALTASSQVYSWGMNSSGQLGHTEDGPSPFKVKSLSQYPVWDIACGHTHSLFLVDSTGFMPDVCYSGKQPSEGVYVPVVKTAKPVGLTFLKKGQTGWVRKVQAKGDNCMCLVDKDNQGGRATQFEFSSTERTFNMLLLKIATQLTRPLYKSDFVSNLKVEPFRQTLLKMLDAFITLTRKIGRSTVELTSIVRDGGCIMTSEMISQCEEYVVEFHRYSRAFCDFLAVGGFEYCAKNGSQFFDGQMSIFQELLDFVSKNNHAQNFSQVMMMPFDRLKEYCRLTNKMTLNFPDESCEEKHLVKCCLLWEKLKTSITTEYNMAESTRAFWDTLSNRLTDSLRVPKRRLIKSSKSCPLSLFSAGRFSANLFILFDDTFVHAQGSTFTSFPLSLVWVETPTETEQIRNVILVTTPEDTLTLSTPSAEYKAEWLMALNQAINKVLTNQKVGKRVNSSDRLTPPMVRFAKYLFTKAAFKDVSYNGYWLNGLMNGQGELLWPDGKRYTGKFRLGLQHGHGILIQPKPDGEELYDGNWKDGKMHGLGQIKYANGDMYEGYLKDGHRSGHGTLKQGRHTSNAASIYIGEWINDRRQGYGVMDDVLKGEKYMGVWNDDVRNGAGVVVTLDGMYFEGTFYQNRMVGFGIMLTDDNSCYEGDFYGITQLSGKGTLTMPNGDKIEGQFNGSWNQGLKVNGTFHKNPQGSQAVKTTHSHDLGIQSSNYGKLCVQAHEKWEDIFAHCRSLLGYNGFGKPDTKKAWEVVAVMVNSGKRAIKEGDKRMKALYRLTSLEALEKIPPHSIGKLTIQYYEEIKQYLQKAFDTPFHPLGKLIEALVDVFRAAYIGVGAHPRLLRHAVEEITSYIKRIYGIIRILFPDLPGYGGPKQIFSEETEPGIPLTTEEVKETLQDNAQNLEESGVVITPAGLLHPILLPKIYPPLFDLYALFNDKEDEKYWERVQRLNRQGDMALMAYLGIDQKFWLIEDSMFLGKRESLSAMKDTCYSQAFDTLQRLSTAFSPAEKLAVIEQTFVDISQAVQMSIAEETVWNMDDLFPIFQFVVVRSKIRHLGAEIHMIEDLMEKHLEFGEFGLMFTTLKACYFQIQTEKLPMH